MSVSVEGHLVRDLIKKMMKRNGYKYEDLAQLLGLSIHSVKRLMTTEDLTFERLVKISQWLGLSVFELLELAKENTPQWSEFTEKQEEFLAVNPAAAYFNLMLMVGLKPKDIALKYNLDKRQTEKILFDLEKHDFIESYPEGRIRVKVSGPFKWKSGGAMEKKYFHKFMDTIYFGLKNKVTGFSSPLSSKEHAPLVRPFEAYMSEATYQEMVKALEDVFNQYRMRARLDRTSEHFEKLRVVSGLLMMDKFNAWGEVFGGLNGKV